MIFWLNALYYRLHIASFSSKSGTIALSLASLCSVSGISPNACTDVS